MPTKGCSEKVRIKRIYDPPEPEDGVRILATIYWPRGIRKDRVDLWLKALGTPPDLLQDWIQERISFEEFADSYRESLQRKEALEALGEVQKFLEEGRSVTLLTSFRDLSRSHLIILKQVIGELGSAE